MVTHAGRLATREAQRHCPTLPGTVCRPLTAGGPPALSLRDEVDDVVKKGQLAVSEMDPPQQGEDRDFDALRIKRRGGSHSQSRAKSASEGSSFKG